MRECGLFSSYILLLLQQRCKRNTGSTRQAAQQRKRKHKSEKRIASGQCMQPGTYSSLAMGAKWPRCLPFSLVESGILEDGVVLRLIGEIDTCGRDEPMGKWYGATIVVSRGTTASVARLGMQLSGRA